MTTTGIHHITAISSDAQGTIDFYSGILGLRLVKKSVNQDDVSTYHLFFGNREGSPGMDLTFFPFQPARPGQSGAGSVAQISLAIPADSLGFWQERLEKHSVNFKLQPTDQKQSIIACKDPDGLELQLIPVAMTEIPKHFRTLVWSSSAIPAQSAIHAFYGATLYVDQLDLIAPVLNLLGYSTQSTDDTIWQIPKRNMAHQLQIVTGDHLPPHSPGAGTVHHIAFGVRDESELTAYRQILLKQGLRPTQIINRYYFQSVYFQTPAGILCELATHEPGFTVDEPVAQLGERLALPPFLEPYRLQIESQLPVLHLDQQT